MSVLTSGLETIDYGTQGWSAIVTANVEKVDESLRGPFLADNDLGELTVSDNSGSQADPNAATAVAPTITSVSGTGDDSTINTNFTNLETQLNNLISDVANIRSIAEGTIDYCDSLKSTLNTLLGKLRSTGGCGVLGD